MKNVYKLINYPSPIDTNDLVRLSDLSQYISLNKMARFVEGVEFTTTTPGSTNHTPFLIKFNYLLSIWIGMFWHIAQGPTMRSAQFKVVWLALALHSLTVPIG